MNRPDDWNELDDAYLEIFGAHPDLDELAPLQEMGGAANDDGS
jgi:hypothetical protein